MHFQQWLQEHSFKLSGINCLSTY